MGLLNERIKTLFLFRILNFPGKRSTSKHLTTISTWYCHLRASPKHSNDHATLFLHFTSTSRHQDSCALTILRSSNRYCKLHLPMIKAIYFTPAMRAWIASFACSLSIFKSLIMCGQALPEKPHPTLKPQGCCPFQLPLMSTMGGIRWQLGELDSCHQHRRHRN